MKFEIRTIALRTLLTQGTRGLGLREQREYILLFKQTDSESGMMHSQAVPLYRVKRFVSELDKTRIKMITIEETKRGLVLSYDTELGKGEACFYYVPVNTFKKLIVEVPCP